MPIESRYIFTASMDVDPDYEDLFNEVYDTEHVPFLSAVPGVYGVTRIVNEAFSFSIGGQVREVANPNEPKYSAIYEIASPDVLLSDAWAEASERGRWASEVRPHTRNRSHTVKRVLE